MAENLALAKGDISAELQGLWASASLSNKSQKLRLVREILTRAEENVGVRNAAVRPGAVREERKELEASTAVDSLFRQGLRPGMTVGVFGSRLASLLLAATLSERGAWCIYLGSSDTGWGAAARLGLELERTVVIPRIEAALSGRIASLAVDGFDVVVCGKELRLDRRAKKALSRRALDRGAVVIGEGWDTRETVSAYFVSAFGTAEGSGHIGDIYIDLESSARRNMRVCLDARGWHVIERLRAVGS